LSVRAVARRTGTAQPTVRRWRRRFREEGVAGLLRDRTRPPGTAPLPPGTAPLPPATVRRVLELTGREPPGEATHWTGRMMAEAVGISLRSVQRIWAAHGLAPHRIRRFKLSRDPAFAAKLVDVVGLYTSTRRRTRWCSRSTRSRGSRRWSAPGRACRSRTGGRRP
jgi:hypothetical protein